MRLHWLQSALAGICGFAVTITFSPYGSEVYSQPKLVALTICAVASLVLLATSFRGVIASEFRTVLTVVTSFILSLFLVLLFSGAPMSQQLFGNIGRNTGLIAYLSLAIILLASALYSSSDSLYFAQLFLLGASTLSTIYALLQRFNADPFPTFTIYRPIISFVGNPDFQSSFSAFTVICAIGLFFTQRAHKYLRIYLILFVEAALFIVIETQALQGIIVIAIGLLTLAGIKVFKDPLFFGYRKLYLATVPLLTGLSLAGSLNHGPFASLLYKDSVASRGDFWRAGITMAKDHPLFGVGLDNYRSFFEQSRDQRALDHKFGEMADAAHNVFIDFAANGGLVLFISYCAVIGLTLLSIYRVLKTSAFNQVYATTVAIWIGYLAQSIISINQLSLAIWGWVFSGLLIGYSIKPKSIKA